MTMALCFNCGDVKFGSFCPCPKCQASSSGNPQLDIIFSDHHYAVQTLEEFGTFIRAIQPATEDAGLRLLTFVHYISERHPEILQVNLEPEVESRVAALLSDIKLPTVTIRASGMHRPRSRESTDDA